MSGDDRKGQEPPSDPSGGHGPPAARGAHLTPDLPPAAEAPELRGAVRPRREDSPAGREAELPPPYGPLGRRGARRRSG